MAFHHRIDSSPFLSPDQARRRKLVQAGLLAPVAAAAVARTAHAQAWPAKPLTIISPYPAGGITDQLCRIVAFQLAKELGQPVVVDNRTGAGGAIAMSIAARAAPDGYTLVMGGNAPSAVIPALSKSINYDPVKDFEPIAYVAGLPIALVVNPEVPAMNIKGLLEYARKNADKLNCAHHGVGSGNQLMCLEFSRIAGVKITDVPYKGGPSATEDLLANRVQFYFAPLVVVMGLIKSGKLRAIGITSETRTSFAPDIPTLAEQGVNDLNLNSWNALYAPAGTPAPVLARLRSALQKVLADPSVRSRIEATGSTMNADSGADYLRKLTADELRYYRKLSAETGIQLN